MKPRILITTGDPAGIGPEVTLKALASPGVRGLADFLVIGDAFVLEDIQRRAGLREARLPLIDMANVPRTIFSYGAPRPFSGRAAISYIDKALELLGQGAADALVTAPVNKASIRQAVFSDFEGHTEYLAARTRTKDFAMMFVGRRLKITLVTRHIALRAVARRLSVELVLKTIALTHEYIRKYFNILQPRIGVAGLNPHAGESGMFGDEETRVIIPAIKKISKKVNGISGPYPPDVIFHELFSGRLNAAVAMYHDQGLIPFKMLYFKDGVNLTLGLPFVRTSPDHGTAFDIAGKGIANPASMIAAIRLACRLARHTP